MVLTKAEARARAYAGLHEAKAARFPFPIEGRIPNFVGAEAAARRLRELPAYKQAGAVKVNPDAPQLPVRAAILEDGKTLYMPSPRLKAGFLRIAPEAVPPGEERRAASLSHCAKYGEEITVEQLARVVARLPVENEDGNSGSGGEDKADIGKADIEGAEPTIGLVIAGSAAVSRRGARAGKGEGYADIEYAILQELGGAHVPVATTVHEAQVVGDIALEPHDLAVDYVITPDETIATDTPYPKPGGIAWELLDEDDLRSMPILAELRRLNWESFSTPDLLAPDLNVLFVGINPGRKSAADGHNFAGPGNHFWRLLHDAGWTPRRYEPREERLLLQDGIGITNVVSRASRGEDDLTWDELVAGGVELRATIERLRPRVVALLGKNVYRAYAGMKRHAAVEWGLQPESIVDGAVDFVAPNPSARSTIPYEQRLAAYRAIREL